MYLRSKRRAKAANRWSIPRVEVTRAIDGVRLCIEHIRGHAGDVMPMGTTAAAVRPHRVHAEGTDRRRGRGERVQPSPQSDRSSGAGGRCGGLPGDRQTGEHHAAVVSAPRAAAARSRVCRMAGARWWWRGARLRSSWSPTAASASSASSAAARWVGRCGLSLRPGTRCALEHGGVAPVIIGPDADQELSLNAVLKGGFYHAGQVCVSVQRVYVPRAQARGWAQALAERANKLQHRRSDRCGHRSRTADPAQRNRRAFTSG